MPVPSLVCLFVISRKAIVDKRFTDLLRNLSIRNGIKSIKRIIYVASNIAVAVVGVFQGFCHLLHDRRADMNGTDEVLLVDSFLCDIQQPGNGCTHAPRTRSEEHTSELQS